ncbi:MAG: N-acetylmuramoyl-L-alanine amidase [Clostridiales bacterium]|nr:N-acetylmuramoyl-L-alanine amidase [Clostridiales bacterium]
MKICEIDWKWKNGLSSRAKTNYVVLHHAAAKACSPYQVDSWHKANGWTGIGYHYFVRKDGTIYRGRPEWATGAHAQGKNHESIGICAEGNYDEEYIMPDAQKDSIQELLRDIKLRYPNTTVKGHRNVGATSCPGKYYPLSEMMTFYRNIIPNESEVLSVTQYEELKKEINQLKTRVGYFNYIDNNMNESYRPTVEKLVNSGRLKGNEKGELMLTNDMMRILTILDRVGVFG